MEKKTPSQLWHSLNHMYTHIKIKESLLILNFCLTVSVAYYLNSYPISYSIWIYPACWCMVTLLLCKFDKFKFMPCLKLFTYDLEQWVFHKEFQLIGKKHHKKKGSVLKVPSHADRSYVKFMVTKLRALNAAWPSDYIAVDHYFPLSKTTGSWCLLPFLYLPYPHSQLKTHWGK